MPLPTSETISQHFKKPAEIKIAVIGLGYVGLPLAYEFAKKYPVTGFDINQSRLNELRKGVDHTLEVGEEALRSVAGTGPGGVGLHYTDKLDDIKACNVYIVTVPTPIDKFNRPDLTALHRASETVGKVLRKNDVVVYESTVYPGVTEEECVPRIQQVSGLAYNIDFFAGYSPERINPGDKEHTVTKILKVTSGSTPEVAEYIDQLYKSIITQGTHKAPSIKVAEAAKVIENSQRDINIAFVNELSKIFNLMGLDTGEVLRAAGTKWNFLKFTPGLVGGHCIGVDPYYLAQKAQELGYHPEIILAGRRLNDSMGVYVADEVIKLMVRKGKSVFGSKVLVLGFTFKENCPDIRNTKVIDIVKRLEEYKVNVSVHDPWANAEEIKHEYGVSCSNDINETDYDAVIAAVAHRQFAGMDIGKICKNDAVIYDIKSIFEPGVANARL